MRGLKTRRRTAFGEVAPVSLFGPLASPNDEISEISPTVGVLAICPIATVLAIY